jgi:hypothetical protein
MVSQPTAVSNATPPDWVSDWLTSRAKREEKQKEKVSHPESVDNRGDQARRIAARVSKVKAGVEDLHLWLKDLIRQGLASIQTESYNFWEQPAARMIDAQAPSLARQLREMSTIASSGKGWEERILFQLGKLQLVLEGFQRIETLPLGIQADIRTQIGWVQTQSELFGVNSTKNEINSSVSEKKNGDKEIESNKLEENIWLVMGQQIETEERLRINRTWLWGTKNNRAALILQFAHGTKPFETNFIVGAYLEAELAFFDSSYPLRAVIKNRKESTSILLTDSITDSIKDILGSETIDIAIAAYSNALACNPWLERFPFLIRAVVPILIEGQMFLSDRNFSLIPISARFERKWILLALSGGHPLTICGEWNGFDFFPLSMWVEGKLHLA